MKRLKTTIFLLILFSTGYICKVSAKTQTVAKWTVMVYAQTDSILNSFVIKNFQSMSTIGSNKNLNIVAQWNQPRNIGRRRYKIEKNEMRLIDTLGKKNSFDLTQDLIDFAAFTAANYPAENYVFILSGHGLGIVDPEWKDLQNFSINPVALRSILFDISNKNYLTNQGLIKALDHITKRIIFKKFAIIGMDACLMSMLEVHYQIRGFADYAVASEEVELAHGWNYPPFLYSLANSSTTTQTPNLAKDIVCTFEDFYRNKTKFYTQSAIDLEGIEYVKQNLDQIISDLEHCKAIDQQKIKDIIQNSRKLCFQLSVSCYIDLHSFYSELLKQISLVELKSKDSEELTHSEHFENLKKNILLGIELLDNIVVANATSKYLSRAKGISIYFPQKNIDPSYIKTEFVQKSLWLSFLEQTFH